MTLIRLVVSYVSKQDLLIQKKAWAENLLKLLNVEVEHLNHPPQIDSAIVVGNHQSILDIPILMSAEPRSVFLAKWEVSTWPIIGDGAKRVGTLFVKRHSPLSRNESKRQIKLKLQNENTVIAGFPSGTTTLNEEVVWKKGLFELAQEAEVPVVGFRIKYSPQRECAYIDEDNLLLTIKRIYKTTNKKVTIEWLNPIEITDPIQQAEEFRRWTQMSIENEKTTSSHRSARSYEL